MNTNVECWCNFHVFPKHCGINLRFIDVTSSHLQFKYEIKTYIYDRFKWLFLSKVGFQFFFIKYGIQNVLQRIKTIKKIPICFSTVLITIIRLLLLFFIAGTRHCFFPFFSRPSKNSRKVKFGKEISQMSLYNATHIEICFCFFFNFEKCFFVLGRTNKNI